jgi:hypothetical protein
LPIRYSIINIDERFNMSLTQAMDLTGTTGAGGNLTGSFDSDFDQVVATPQNTSIVSASCQKTGSKTFSVRCWTQVQGQIVPASNTQVTVSLIAYTH